SVTCAVHGQGRRTVTSNLVRGYPIEQLALVHDVAQRVEVTVRVPVDVHGHAIEREVQVGRAAIGTRRDHVVFRWLWVVVGDVRLHRCREGDRASDSYLARGRRDLGRRDVDECAAVASTAIVGCAFQPGVHLGEFIGADRRRTHQVVRALIWPSSPPRSGCSSPCVVTIFPDLGMKVLLFSDLMPRSRSGAERSGAERNLSRPGAPTAPRGHATYPTPPPGRRSARRPCSPVAARHASTSSRSRSIRWYAALPTTRVRSSRRARTRRRRRSTARYAAPTLARARHAAADRRTAAFPCGR